MARPLRGVEEPRELSEAEAGDAAGEERARETHGVDDRRADAGTGQELGLAVEEGQVEARVVRDEHRIAGESEEAPDGVGGAGCAAQVLVAEAGDRARSGCDRHSRIDERLELGVDLEPAEAHRSDLADPRLAGPQPRRLEVDDDVRRVLEEELAPGGSASATASPFHASRASVSTTSARSVRARATGRLSKREEPSRRVLREHRPALLLHELHEAVGRV